MDVDRQVTLGRSPAQDDDRTSAGHDATPRASISPNELGTTWDRSKRLYRSVERDVAQRQHRLGGFAGAVHVDRDTEQALIAEFDRAGVTRRRYRPRPARRSGSNHSRLLNSPSPLNQTVLAFLLSSPSAVFAGRAGYYGSGP